VVDPWPNYVSMVSGLSKATRLGLVRVEDLTQPRAEIAALRAQVIVLTAPGSDPAAIRTAAKRSPATRTTPMTTTAAAEPQA